MLKNLMSNTYIQMMWKPFLIITAVVVCILIAYSIFLLIKRVRGF